MIEIKTGRQRTKHWKAKAYGTEVTWQRASGNGPINIYMELMRECGKGERGGGARQVILLAAENKYAKTTIQN